MADDECASCDALKNQTPATSYCKYHITSVTRIEETSSGFLVTFKLAGYDAREFKVDWRLLADIFVCDPTKFPAGFCEYTSSYTKVPEVLKQHASGTSKWCPKMNASGDVMLSNHYVTRNGLDFRQAEKWPGHLPGATYSDYPMVSYGWALALELKGLAGVTFYVSPARRDLLGDLSDATVTGPNGETWKLADTPFNGRVGSLQVPIERNNWLNILGVQFDANGDVEPWSGQRPNHLAKAVGRHVLFSGGREPDANSSPQSRVARVARTSSGPSNAAPNLSRDDLVNLLESMLESLR